MARAPVLHGIEGEATHQARTGGWDQEVLGKENHPGEVHKIYRSRSVQGHSSCGGG